MAMILLGDLYKKVLIQSMKAILVKHLLELKLQDSPLTVAEELSVRSYWIQLEKSLTSRSPNFFMPLQVIGKKIQLNHEQIS